MRLSVLSSFVLVGAVFSSSAAYGIADDLSGYCTDTERTAARAFVAAHWRDVVQEFPFSFKYGGVSSREFLHDWKLERNMKKLDAKRTQISIKLTDPKTGLEVSAETIEYRDFPALDWTLYFKNGGSSNTPIISAN